MELTQQVAFAHPPSALSTPAELLAALLEPATPRPLVAVTDQVMVAGLQSWTDAEACERAVDLGLSREQASRLRSCALLFGRLESDGWPMPSPICGPADALAHLGDIRESLQERVVALYLDTRNRPLRRETIAIGGLKASVIQPRDVIGPALTLPASGLILAHNHPSGDTRPSADDVEVTAQLAAAAKLFGLELVDHLVVARRGYCSLKEMGKM